VTALEIVDQAFAVSLLNGGFVLWMPWKWCMGGGCMIAEAESIFVLRVTKTHYLSRKTPFMVAIYMKCA
jgi:hypothetical protein